MSSARQASRRRRVGSSLALLAVIGLLGCRTAPLIEPTPIHSPLGEGQNREAIFRGLSAHRWLPVAEDPGLIVAKYEKDGRHEAEVAIAYDDRSIRIRYRRSSGLRCEPAGASCSEIHRAYNRWVVQLAKDIEYATQTARLDERGLPPVGAR